MVVGNRWLGCDRHLVLLRVCGLEEGVTESSLEVLPEDVVVDEKSGDGLNPAAFFLFGSKLCLKTSGVGVTLGVEKVVSKCSKERTQKHSKTLSHLRKTTSRFYSPLADPQSAWFLRKFLPKRSHSSSGKFAPFSTTTLASVALKMRV